MNIALPSFPRLFPGLPERAPVSDPIPAGARAASEAPKRDPNAVIAECQRQMARCLGFGYHAGQEL